MKRMILLIALLLAACTLSGVEGRAADAIPTRDISMRAGADYRFQFTRSHNGTPIDLTGCTYYGQFRAAPGGAVFATFSTNTVAPDSSGRISVRLSRAQTATLSGKSGTWDLLERNAAGLLTYIMSGRVTVLPTSTRLP